MPSEALLERFCGANSLITSTARSETQSIKGSSSSWMVAKAQERFAKAWKPRGKAIGN